MDEGARLLIVDDEPDIVRMLGAFFEGEGYRCVCATSAREALEAVNAALAGGKTVRSEQSIWRCST